MALTSVDHKRLVEAHIDGDEDAFTAIVQAYYESLFAHAMRRTGDAHAAEDAVQETLSRAYRALPRFSGDYEMRAWLHRILTNVCHDEGRRRKRERLTFDRVAATHAEVPPVDQDLAVLNLPRREVLDALAALPASYREALVLRYVEELSFHDVAAASGISEGNARLRVHRGRAALRRALAPFAGVLVFLAPFLRRGQRAALAAQMGAESQVAMVASAPVVHRVAESSVTLADKAPSLPSMIGVAASLMAPAALPVLSDRVVDHVARPAAAVAAPFESDAPGQAGTPLAVIKAVEVSSSSAASVPTAPDLDATMAAGALPPTAVGLFPDGAGPPATGAPAAPTAEATAGGPDRAAGSTEGDGAGGEDDADDGDGGDVEEDDADHDGADSDADDSDLESPERSSGATGPRSAAGPSSSPDEDEGEGESGETGETGDEDGDGGAPPVSDDEGDQGDGDESSGADSGAPEGTADDDAVVQDPVDQVDDSGATPVSTPPLAPVAAAVSAPPADRGLSAGWAAMVATSAAASASVGELLG